MQSKLALSSCFKIEVPKLRSIVWIDHEVDVVVCLISYTFRCKLFEYRIFLKLWLCTRVAKIQTDSHVASTVYVVQICCLAFANRSSICLTSRLIHNTKLKVGWEQVLHFKRRTELQCHIWILAEFEVSSFIHSLTKASALTERQGCVYRRLHLTGIWSLIQTGSDRSLSWVLLDGSDRTNVMLGCSIHSH